MEKFNADLEASKDNFKNGPIGKRSITDCLCCLIFIAAIVGFCGASYYGWENGDPTKLLIGWDADQNGCGYSDKTKDYKYMYWPEPPSFDPLEAVKGLSVGDALTSLKYGMCVKKCPTADLNEPIECYPTRYVSNNSNYDGC